MLTKTMAIVLHSFKYGEAKLIADILAESGGRMSCIARIPSTPNARMRRQFFQPLTLLEAVIDQRPGASLQPLREARIARSFTSIPFHPLKLSLAMFTAEFLHNATRGETQGAALFSYIEKGVTWLDECAGQFSNFHLVFTMRLTKFLGFYPNTEHYHAGDWFDLRSGCFTSIEPLHRDRISPDEASLINTMLRMNFPTMHLYRMTRAERNRLLEIILDYYRIHVPGFREMKSVEVLRELF